MSPCWPGYTAASAGATKACASCADLEESGQAALRLALTIWAPSSLALGDEDRALALLNEAYRQRSSGLIFLREARFNGLQRAPEFHSLVEKMHFAG